MTEIEYKEQNDLQNGDSTHTKFPLTKIFFSIFSNKECGKNKHKTIKVIHNNVLPVSFRNKGKNLLKKRYRVYLLRTRDISNISVCENGWVLIVYLL